ncbi:MAG: 3-dehydroquinate synthase [Dactylosporangium sp.]|nr:3-dehydroquinate synthase [Dactylosporangium sp.]NNJ63605.1 3-dehydroquinate synthase [Dactylosporangium sp.]
MENAIRIFDDLELYRSSSGSIIGSASRLDRYPVHVTSREHDALDHVVQEIDDRRVALVSDDTVGMLHAGELAARLVDRGLRVDMRTFPAGEGSKSVGTAIALLDWLADTALARRDVILAVGGGVVIDTVGWVASAYMRGVPYINVPTTLLGQVDAALGGKVAVDHSSAKNLIGAFYQPKAVVSHVGYLKTLDARQLRAGLAEAIKKGIIASPTLFGFIEEHRDDILGTDPRVLETLVRGASNVKCELIARDPYEIDLRRPLNFGHTVGHAVETVTGYGPILHGEAVAFGMAVAADIARRREALDGEVYVRILRLLEDVGLPVRVEDFAVPVGADDVVAALDKIRKIRDGRLRFVLPARLGETLVVDDVTDDEIRAAVADPRRTGATL